MTDNAKELAVKKLMNMLERGIDPIIVMENSIFNSYQGLYEPKQESSGGKRTPQNDLFSGGI